MTCIKAWEVKGKQIPAPYERVLKILASPETPKMKAENFTFGMSIIAAGSKTDKHAHEGTEECIYVVSGRGEAVIAGEKYEIGPDVVILVKPGQDHQFFNHSDETMRLIWVYAPPGAEKSLLKMAVKKS